MNVDLSNRAAGSCSVTTGEPGVLKVTVQTAQLTQKKELQVGACDTLGAARCHLGRVQASSG